LSMVEYCKKQHPDMIDYYNNMSTRLNSGKPTDWDGTYRATSK
jgi:hypothetical protein